MRVVHICSCCTCVYNYSRLPFLYVSRVGYSTYGSWNLIYVVIIFLSAGNFYFSLVSTLLAYITIPKNKRKKNYLRSLN